MMIDSRIRIGHQVIVPDLYDEGVQDVGTVEHWDGGWYVRINKTGELTGGWEASELELAR